MAIPRRLLRGRQYVLNQVRNLVLLTEADIHRLQLWADLHILYRVAHLRDDMAAYEARFPAAVAVRDQLGNVQWEELERYRLQTTRNAVSLRRLDRERFQVSREQLGPLLPRLRDWILRTFGHREAGRFDQVHTAVRDARSMADFKRWFHHRPFMWLVYNLAFDVGQRMEWGQQMQWVLWTLQHPQSSRFNVELIAGDELMIRGKVEVYQWILEAWRVA